MKKKVIVLVLCGVMALNVPVYAKGGSVSLSKDELQVPKTEQKKDKKESKKKKNQDITVTQSGWTIQTSDYDNDRYVSYGAKVTNSGSKKYGYVTLNIAVKDANGKILKTTDDTFSSIVPGDTVFSADKIHIGQYDPASVEFSVSYEDSDFLESISADFGTDVFTLSNLSEMKDEYGYTTITGEIESEASDDCTSACVTVLLEQGESIVGGFYGYADVTSGETTVFEISDHDLPEHDNVEISARSTW